MEGAKGLLDELEQANELWLNDRGAFQHKLKSVSSRLINCVEDASQDEVPGLLEVVLGKEGDTSNNFLSFAMDLAKDKQKERSKDGGDLLQHVAEVLGSLIQQYPEKSKPELKRLVKFAKALFFCHSAAKVRVAGLHLLEICVSSPIPGSREQQQLAEDLGVESLGSQLHNALASRPQPSVLAKLRCVLGAAVKAFPEQLQPLQLDLRNSFIREMSRAVAATTSNLDLTLVEGTLAGLNALLAAFPFEDGEEEGREQLYELLRKLCRRPEHEEVKVRRGAMRTALDLFACHSSLFSDQVLADTKYWFPLLSTWLRASNKDDSRAGWRAMDAFVDTVAAALVHKPVKETNREVPASLSFLAEKFKDILLSTNTNSKSMGLAIQGFGKLAPAMVKFYPVPEFVRMVEDVLYRAEQVYLQAGKKEDTWLLQLPGHLLACAGLISSMPCPSPIILSTLERLAVLLMDQFPMLPMQYHFRAVKAILATLETAGQHEGENVEESLVEQAILRSCSHPAVVAGQGETLDPHNVSVHSYLPLWTGLLQSKASGEQVYNLLVSSMIATVDKLDLSIEPDSDVGRDEYDEDFDTDTLSDTQVSTSQSQSFAATTPRALCLRQKACKVKDHTVMVNLATLACHALPLLPDALVTWAPSLWQSLGAWAQAHPQVSAWYKLARMLVKEVKELDSVSRSLLATFLSDVAEKTPSFHDELQLSCFQLILDVNDVSCVEVLLPFLPPVISSLLNLSNSLLWLAEATLVRLLEWLDKLGEEKMAAVLCTALPLLRPHLATDYASIMVEGKETTGVKKRRKQIKAGLQKLKAGERECGVRVSRLALALLARVSSHLKNLLLPTEEQEGERATGWLHTPLCPLELPLPDLPPLKLRLDTLLPLLTDLLQESPDRRVRVAAAELLHVLSVVLVGWSATQTQEEATRFPLEPLFARLLPLLLKFSCDADSVLQSLFSPLLNQLCHWWSRPSRSENSFSSLLVEILMEGVTKREVAERERATELLKEFLHWGVRQGGGVQQARILLGRLPFLWRHPTHTKRLAASTIFNCLYRVFREQRDLVSVFLLEALVSVFSSLRFSSQGSEEVEAAAVLSLENMKKILIHYFALFLNTTEGRRIPSELKEGSVKHLQLHLLSLSRQPCTCLRQKAMELLFMLHRRSPLDWKAELEVEHGGGEAFLRQLVEDQPGLKDVELHSLAAREAVAWLQGLQTVLECLGMVASEKIVSTSQVNCVVNKLAKLCKEFVDWAVIKEEDCLSRDLDYLRKGKCTTLVRLFTLLADFVNCGDLGLRELVETLDKSLVQILLMSLLEPSQVGFRLKTRDRKEFQACCNNLVQALANHMPNFKAKLATSLAQDYVKSDFLSPEAIARADRLGSVEEEVILGYIHLQRQGVLTISCNVDQLWEIIKAKLLVTNVREAKKCLVLLVELLVVCSSTEERHLWEKFQKLALDEESQSKRLIQLLRKPLAPLFLLRARPLLSENLRSPRKFLNLSKLLLRMGGLEGKEAETKISDIIRDFTFSHWLDLVEGGESDGADKGTWIFHLVNHLTRLGNLSDNWEKGKEVVRWYCAALSSQALRLKVKFRLLALLPALAKLAGTGGESLVKTALLSVARLHFPAVSGELKEGSLELAEYTSIWRLLLSSLETTAYPPIFYLLLSVVCREEEHCLEEEFQGTLLTTMSSASSTDQHRLLDSVWGILIDDSGDFAPRIKLAATSRALLPALLSASVPVIITFYSSRLDTILRAVAASPRGGEDSKSATLTQQICCLQLISALYSRLERHLVHGPSDVTKQAADVLLANKIEPSVKGDGKELSTFLVKCLSAKRSLVCPEGSSKDLEKLFRAFHCTSLNCMVAVICCIQDTEKIYDRYIFKEIPGKQELLWSRIVETDNDIVFGMEQGEVRRRRRQVVAVRRSGADNKAPSGFLQSHYLADSSLSQDVSRYDFTSSLGSGTQNIEARALQAGSDLQFLEVENSEIGRHPCLPSLIACIRHMESKAMYPTTTSSPGGEQPQPPGWMKSILAVLENPDSPRNVLLFLLKLVLSCPDTFLHFSATFFAPILALLADGRLQGPEVFIDYFSSDLLILLLSWTSKCNITPNRTQEEKFSATRVLSFLIRHVHNDRRDILRHNLELLRSVAELWRPALVLDIEIVIDLLKSQGGSGVQVLATLLINKLGDPAALSNEALWSPIVDRLALKDRKDCRSAAETIGLLLARLAGDQPSRLGLEVLRKIERMAGGRTAEDQERFVDLLYHMHLHYPPVALQFLPKFQGLHHKSGTILTQCLAMVRSSSKKLKEEPESVATELRMIGFQQVLQRGEPVDQKICLELLEEVVECLDPADAKSFLSLVSDLVDHSDTEMRKKSLELLGKQYKREALAEEVKQVCLSALLSGLGDSDMEVQMQAVEVLTSKLPADTLQMVVDILSKLHLSGQEPALLSFLPLALLSSATRSPSFASPIFRAPLDTCEFNAHHVETDWRVQHQTALLPQFADTLSSSQSQDVSANSSQRNTRGPIQLLATQATTLEFQPTQTGSSLPPSLASSLLALPNSSTVTSNQLQDGTAPNLGRLQVGKRFYKTDDQSGDVQTGFFAKRAARDKVAKKLAEEERRARKVALTRSYRKGDLPDIQVSYADLVKPMQTLCQASSEFAQCLFSTLLTAVLEASRQGVEEEESGAVILALAKVITDASPASPQLLSSAMATLLEQSHGARLAPERLSQIASQCDLGSLAALTLEKALLGQEKDEGEPEAKRRKENPGEDKHSMTWLHLSDVYKTLGERDNVTGVFSMKNNLNIHPKTGEALALETSGNLKGAQDVYRELLDQARQGRQRQEVDLWKRGFLSSFAKLGQWDKLAAQVVKEVGDNFEAVWLEDKRYLLPPLLQSHMHLLLDQPNLQNNIFDFLGAAFKDKKKQAVVWEQGSVEVAAMLAKKKHFGVALNYLSKALVQQRLECFQHGRKNTDLLALQAGSELEGYLLEKTGQAGRGKYSTEPRNADNLCAWDNILSVRSLFNSSSASPVELGKSYCRMGDAAIFQGNMSMATMCLRNLKQKFGGSLASEPELQEMHDFLYMKTSVLSSQTNYQKLTAAENFSRLFRQFLRQQKEVNRGSKTFMEIKTCVFSQLLSIVEEETELTTHAVEATLRHEEDRRELRNLLNQRDLQTGLEVLVMSVLQKHLNMVGQNTGQNQQAVANFAFTRYRRGGENSGEMSTLVIRHQMLAIQAGNLNARQLFPRILSLLTKACSEENSQVLKEFEALQAKIAAWTVLPWINQLMAALHNEATARLVLPLVESLASAFPQATRHPFLASLSAPGNQTAKTAKLKLDLRLEASSIEKSFEHGIALISSPHIAGIDLLKRLPDLKKEHPDSWREKVLKEYNDFKTLYLEATAQQGDFHKKFAKEFSAKFAGYFSSFKGGTELDKQLRDTRLRLPTNLKSYSLFLARYQGRTGSNLEIPGQYKGWTKPDPSRHVMVASFEPGVRPFASLRQPIRMGMLGEDGNLYQWIVKAGEDLRQDQRVQQLFRICNESLAQDPEVKASSLFITTYAVLPLSTTLGLIEFVPKTLPFKEFMRSVEGAGNAMDRTLRAYTDGLSKLTGDKLLAQACLSTWKLDKERVAVQYQEIVARADSSTLRTALVNLSSSPEGFFILRKNFVQSFAVVSAMQWLVGIGDRHLSNYLLHLPTGKCVTIDFGYSFGVATSFLLVPELVQLRLTPQLLSVMAPLGTAGPFRETLAKVLTRLRLEPDVLLAALETFAQEPTLDWSTLANKESGSRRVEVSLEDFTRGRVDMAKEKLAGGNPSAIMARELESGLGSKRWQGQGGALRRTVQLVEGGRVGGPGRREEGRWGLGGLRGEEQADCLIHQSTDPALLGRMYPGWGPVH